MELILASQSQRRRELFQLIGLEYTCIPSDADENVPFTEPGEFVELLALRKAAAVKKNHPGSCVVGSDTVVWLDNEIIGKPHDREDAYRILRKLSGRTHTVYTGIAVLTDDSTQLCHETTRVTFEDLSDELIWDYIDTGDPMDKAGAYGVQGLGAVLVKKVEGCYFTVIGMSIPKLCEMLKNIGIYPKWQTRCAEK